MIFVFVVVIHTIFTLFPHFFFSFDRFPFQFYILIASHFIGVCQRKIQMQFDLYIE